MRHTSRSGSCTSPARSRKPRYSASSGSTAARSKPRCATTPPATSAAVRSTSPPDFHKTGPPTRGAEADSRNDETGTDNSGGADLLGEDGPAEQQRPYRLQIGDQRRRDRRR